MTMFRNIYFIYFIPVISILLADKWQGNLYHSKYCELLKISDADTITVNCSGVKERVRLNYIDAPESDQLDFNFYFKIGEWATRALKEKLNAPEKGKQLKLVWYEKDSYGRILGEVYDGEENINLWLIKNGWASIYRRAKFRNHKQRLAYLWRLEFAAINKIGIWAVERWMNPALFRSLKKYKWQKPSTKVGEVGIKKNKINSLSNL